MKKNITRNDANKEPILISKKNKMPCVYRVQRAVAAYRHCVARTR